MACSHLEDDERKQVVTRRAAETGGTCTHVETQVMGSAPSQRLELRRQTTAGKKEDIVLTEILEIRRRLMFEPVGV